MNGNMIKEEIKRGVFNKRMVLALLIGAVISISQVVSYQIPANHHNAWMDYEKFPILYPFTVSDTWISGNTGTLEGFVYFLILPILAVLPFGTSYFEDRGSGFIKSIYMKMPRRSYLSAKYLAAFLSGGIAVVTPLVLNLLCAVTILPNLVAQIAMPYNGINANNLFYEIYFSYPLIYIILFLCMNFVMGGIFSCMALACSFISDYKIIVAVFPFFLQLTIHVSLTTFGLIEYSSVYLFQAGYGIEHGWVPLLYIVTGILISASVFMYKGKREDIF